MEQNSEPPMRPTQSAQLIFDRAATLFNGGIDISFSTNCVRVIGIHRQRKKKNGSWPVSHSLNINSKQITGLNVTQKPLKVSEKIIV